MSRLTSTTTHAREAGRQLGAINLLTMAQQQDYGFIRGQRCGTLGWGPLKVPCYDVGVDGVRISSVSNILTTARQLLEKNEAYLNLSMFEINIGIYMLGNNQSNAHLLIACPDRAPRKQARDFLEITSIPESFPPVTLTSKYLGLLLADSSSLPLRATGLASPDEIREAVVDALPTESVYCEVDYPAYACGLPILVHGIQHLPYELGRSTMGGIVKVVSQDGKNVAFRGLTAAHAFTDIFQIRAQDDREADSELSFQGDLYMDDDDFHRAEEEINLVASNEGTGEITRKDPSASVTAALNLPVYKFGQVIASSLEGERQTLDWALIDVLADHLKIQNTVDDNTSVSTIADFASHAPPSGTSVLSVTGSNGITHGTIKSSPILMKFARQAFYQELWIVDMEVVKGDCGSWVIDSRSGTLYGHVVAANPNLKLAYIVPAHQMFEDIELFISGKISLPLETEPPESGRLLRTLDLVVQKPLVSESSTASGALNLPPLGNTDQSFMFVPLSPGKDEIRLIDLLPGNSEEPIRCRIYHASLKNPPPYSALSYTWTNNSALSYAWDTNPFTKSIHIDNSETMITSNLESALYHIRHVTRHQTLWVDYVCINQKDKEECKSQVNLMSSIIRKAENVIVWLGDDPEYRAEETFRILRKVSSAKDFLEVDQSPSDDEQISVKLALILDGDLKPRTSGQFLSQMWSGIEDLVTRPWWSRVWILQDVLLAKRATVVWGKQTLSWDACTNALVKLSRCVPYQVKPRGKFLSSFITPRRQALESTILPKGVGASHDFHQAVILALHFQSPQPSKRPLLQLLADFWPLKSSSGKDKVYALQSLLSDRRESVQVDYSKDLWSVFGDAVYACIVSSGSFEVLELCILPDIYLEDKSTRLLEEDDRRPSWVPNWTREGYEAMMDMYQQHPPLSLYNITEVGIKDPAHSIPMSGFDASPLSSPRLMMREGGVVLVSGSLIDRIERVLHVRDRNSQPLQNVLQSFYPLDDLLKVPLPGGLSVAKREEFYATMTAGQSLSILNHNWFEKMDQATWMRGFAISAEGRYCLVPKDCKSDDVICIFSGGRVPVILRPVDTYFIFIGNAYVHGIMFGEIWEEYQKRKQMFELH